MKTHTEIGIPPIGHRDDQIAILEVSNDRYRIVAWVTVPSLRQPDIVDTAAAAGHISPDAWWNDDDHTEDGDKHFSYFIIPQDA